MFQHLNINVIHYNRLKLKNIVIISIDVENIFEKNTFIHENNCW